MELHLNPHDKSINPTCRKLHKLGNLQLITPRAQRKQNQLVPETFPGNHAADACGCICTKTGKTFLPTQKKQLKVQS